MANGFLMMAGKAPALERVRTVALYERDTGRIVHVHVELTFAGGVQPTDDQIVAATLQRAARRHTDATRLGVALSDDLEHARRPHRIDLGSKAFVPLASSRTRK